MRRWSPLGRSSRMCARQMSCTMSPCLIQTGGWICGATRLHTRSSSRKIEVLEKDGDQNEILEREDQIEVLEKDGDQTDILQNGTEFKFGRKRTKLKFWRKKGTKLKIWRRRGGQTEKLENKEGGEIEISEKDGDQTEISEKGEKSKDVISENSKVDCVNAMDVCTEEKGCTAQRISL